MMKMPSEHIPSEIQPAEIQQPAPVLRLLIEHSSRPRAFCQNLRDLISPRRLPASELFASPAPFWPDVFVPRSHPWGGLLQSFLYHAVALALLIGLSHLFALHPQAVAKPAFDRSEIVYYQPAEYLPPLDTREALPSPLANSDPEMARQPIISLPREADNRSQTIVTAPAVRLRRDVALPNIIAWSEKMEKPRLAIPPVPLIPASEISRIGPQMQDAAVNPPPDAAHLASGRNLPTAENFAIAPPPSVDDFSRPVGDLTIGRTSVIAPAPQLPIAEQWTLSAYRSGFSAAQQLIPPPPSVSSGGASGEGMGTRGRLIALNLHPAVGAPPVPPPGNRLGSFAATPEGHSGASGTPGAASGASAGRTDAGGAGNKVSKGGGGQSSNPAAPAGLYVGGETAKSSPVVGDNNRSVSKEANPKIMASARPPVVTSAPSRPTQPESASRLSAAERAVFGNRKFYSLTLNMPNLNSAGGSWVIRFAELDRDWGPHAAGAAADLSQPSATRKVDPAYPLQLMRENVAGTVILYAIIHADGTVGSVRVLRGVDDRLDQFASQAVAQWQFLPATKNGLPVDVEATFQIPFRPARVGTNF